MNIAVALLTLALLLSVDEVSAQQRTTPPAVPGMAAQADRFDFGSHVFLSDVGHFRIESTPAAGGKFTHSGQGEVAIRGRAVAVKYVGVAVMRYGCGAEFVGPVYCAASEDYYFWVGAIQEKGCVQYVRAPIAAWCAECPEWWTYGSARRVDADRRGYESTPTPERRRESPATDRFDEPLSNPNRRPPVETSPTRPDIRRRTPPMEPEPVEEEVPDELEN